jgi:molybdenum cofactor cytidylyltransferase
MTDASSLSRSAGIVLAAGSSSRMGRPKQLLPVDGRPLLQLVVEQACASSLDAVVVILGAHAAEVLDGVELGRAAVVVNAHHQRGMSSSLTAGIDSLGADVQRAVVILGDQPNVPAALIDDLLSLQRRSGLPAAALSLDGLLHPPVVLARELWGELRQLDGDTGFRHILRARPERVAPLALTSPSQQPVDIDTPEDYRLLVGGSETTR